MAKISTKCYYAVTKGKTTRISKLCYDAKEAMKDTFQVKTKEFSQATQSGEFKIIPIGSTEAQLKAYKKENKL